MSARRVAVVGVAVLIAIGGIACSSPSDDALNRSVGPLESPTTTTSAALPSTTTPAPVTCNPKASLRPAGDTVPAPPDFARYPTVAAIQQKGKLVVGVDEGTASWGYRNPRTATIEGLDVDLLKEIANAIFRDDRPADHLKFITLTTAERIDAVADGKVDMVASLLSATCERWQKVDFSTEYFEAHQDVLVPIDSDIHQVEDLAGKAVCATRGSTSITQIHEKVPTAVLHPVAARADCLVALQEGQVDAITSDDTILASFQSQEKVPRTSVLDLELSNEHYAIAIKQGREDLVRFVNAVLEDMRESGALKQLYRDWLTDPKDPFQSIPEPPVPEYQP